jgi:YesN/AraC family two-component response regulator
MINILLSDDHAIFRAGLRKLLEGANDISVVGEASNGVECMKMLAKLKPDILLLDLRMPEKDGLRKKLTSVFRTPVPLFSRPQKMTEMLSVLCG